MFEIGSNNLTTAGTVIDRKVDHPAVCRLTLERGHQYHLLCHQPPPSSSRIILSVALEIPSTAVNMSKGLAMGELAHCLKRRVLPTCSAPFSVYPGGMEILQ